MLRYLEEHQEQGIELPEEPRDWHSGVNEVGLFDEAYEHQVCLWQVLGACPSETRLGWLHSRLRSARASSEEGLPQNANRNHALTPMRDVLFDRAAIGFAEPIEQLLRAIPRFPPLMA